MLEIKVQLSATDDLIAAMRNLATAFAEDSKTPDPTANIINYPTTGSQPVTEKADAVAAPKQAGVPLTSRATNTVGNTAPVNTVPINAPTNPTTAQGTQQTATPATMPTIAETTATPAVPTSAPQYTLDMIATAGSALIDAGKMDQLMGLLGKFGVASLTELAPENYGAIANELRALGAAI